MQYTLYFAHFDVLSIWFLRSVLLLLVVLITLISVLLAAFRAL